MRPFPTIAALAAAAALAAPASAEAPSPSPTPAPLHTRVGFVAERAAAERAIAFRPWVPADPIVAAALLPPFHVDHDDSRRDGIGYVYTRGARRWLLREWPGDGAPLGAFPAVALDPRCTDAHVVGGTVSPRGFLWRAAGGRIVALLPDRAGAIDVARARGEARRLIRRGACR